MLSFYGDNVLGKGMHNEATRSVSQRNGSLIEGISELFDGQNPEGEKREKREKGDKA